MTGAGIAELFRVLDPEGHTPEKLQAILVQMGAKAMAPKVSQPFSVSLGRYLIVRG